MKVGPKLSLRPFLHRALQLVTNWVFFQNKRLYKAFRTQFRPCHLFQID